MKLKTKAMLRSATATALILSAVGAHAEELRFWTTEEQPERLARQEQMAAAFAE
jgi:multiple sugar transport system substrate-binding protein